MASSQPFLNKDFTELFCDCYAEYVKTLTSKLLSNKNLQEEISPYGFLELHSGMKPWVDSKNTSALADIPYFNRRRYLALPPASQLVIVSFLANLFIFAKLATTPAHQLSQEEKSTGDTILMCSKERAESKNDELFVDIVKELQDDLEGMLSGGNGEILRKQLEAIGHKETMSPMEIMAATMKGCETIGEDGKPVLDLADLVKKVSEKIASKIATGKIDEKEIIRQSMLFMHKLPEFGSK